GPGGGRARSRPPGRTEGGGAVGHRGRVLFPARGPRRAAVGVAAGASDRFGQDSQADLCRLEARPGAASAGSALPRGRSPRGGVAGNWRRGEPLLRPPRPWILRWPGIALAVVIALAYRGSEGDVRRLFSRDSRSALADFALGFWPPAHDADFLLSMARPLMETVAIAFLGISVALILALPLSFLAVAPAVTASPGDRTGSARRISFLAARLLLNGMRSIPELIWALIFVRIFGIGAGAGVLAIGVGYAGVLGKVFAEIFE